MKLNNAEHVELQVVLSALMRDRLVCNLLAQMDARNVHPVLFAHSARPVFTKLLILAQYVQEDALNAHLLILAPRKIQFLQEPAAHQIALNAPQQIPALLLLAQLQCGDSTKKQ